ncbi:MAG: alanine racemase [Treponema sp.]|jgi:D-serine deaminase-like pyridoxal phosphate-dependent protein|nr:alanine racemase [Treponema sp.]
MGDFCIPPLPEHLQRLLETPCIVIDVEKTRENIANMQRAANDARCALRPHIKSHKMSCFAVLQVEAGASGISCAKISEAEIMARDGLDDIFVAGPLAGAFRLRRAVKLARQVRRLILATDSAEGAAALDQAAEAAGLSLEVRMKLDARLGRTGVVFEKALDLAKAIMDCRNLRLTGIYTFKSLPCPGKAAAAGREEGELMTEAARRLRDAGIPLQDISAESAPAGLARTGLVTEIRPGTYIFNDYIRYKEGAAALGDIAAHFYVTVVSTPRRDYAVIDGGIKTFPMDVPLDMPPHYYPSYALADGREDLRLTRLYEEHGILSCPEGGDTGLQVGQILRLIPLHICPAVNLQNEVYLYERGVLYRGTVDARGMAV